MKDEYDFTHTHAEQGKFYLPIDSLEIGVHAKKVLCLKQHINRLFMPLIITLRRLSS